MSDKLLLALQRIILWVLLAAVALLVAGALLVIAQVLSILAG